ncbi:MAG: pilus assembly protein PilY, partial [Bauldia sp.]
EPSPARSYGLDGEIRVYIDNNDGLPGIDAAGGERVILYFGMRRGGDTVYALEVTDRNAPELLWKLSSADAGFENLGQTWSTPSIVKVDIGGTEKKVAIFGGGYDDGQDLAGFRTDTRGNAIYMVDAFTGELLWSAGNGSNHDLELAAMEHSIPAAIKVIDINLDGQADRMYAADMGGRVWRFDIFNGETGGDFVQGGVFASLGAADLGAPPLADVRRFYVTPDVAQVISRNRVFLSVSLGSGHREHPLDTGTNEEFYSMRDYNVFERLTNDQYGPPITRADLTDITNDTSPELPYDSLGWRLTLDQSPGEKVGGESFTFQNSVFFSSFSPGGNGDACVAAGGLNRLYFISVLDGSPRTNGDITTEPQPEDRYYTLQQGGFAPEPVIFFFN